MAVTPRRLSRRFRRAARAEPPPRRAARAEPPPRRAARAEPPPRRRRPAADDDADDIPLPPARPLEFQPGFCGWPSVEGCGEKDAYFEAAIATMQQAVGPHVALADAAAFHDALDAEREFQAKRAAVNRLWVSSGMPELRAFMADPQAELATREMLAAFVERFAGPIRPLRQATGPVFDLVVGPLADDDDDDRVAPCLRAYPALKILACAARVLTRGCGSPRALNQLLVAMSGYGAEDDGDKELVDGLTVRRLRSIVATAALQFYEHDDDSLFSALVTTVHDTPLGRMCNALLYTNYWMNDAKARAEFEHALELAGNLSLVKCWVLETYIEFLLLTRDGQELCGYVESLIDQYLVAADTALKWAPPYTRVILCEERQVMVELKENLGMAIENAAFASDQKIRAPQSYCCRIPRHLLDSYPACTRCSRLLPCNLPCNQGFCCFQCRFFPPRAAAPRLISPRAAVPTVLV